MKVTPGKAKAENRTKAEQEEKAEEKRLAIMMMKKKEKYLYDKIMFGKKRNIREVRRMLLKTSLSSSFFILKTFIVFSYS